MEWTKSSVLRNMFAHGDCWLLLVSYCLEVAFGSVVLRRVSEDIAISANEKEQETLLLGPRLSTTRTTGNTFTYLCSMYLLYRKGMFAGEW